MIEVGKKYKMFIPSLGWTGTVEILFIHSEKRSNLDQIMYRFWGKAYRKYYYAVNTRMQIQCYMEMAENK